MSCPICHSAPSRRYRPFCSRRCADVDLGRWMEGSYSVPLVDVEEDMEELIEATSERREVH
ncbi:MAG: DNA gyrase inhibitor YacG [Rhodobacteraceae bacterium]|nr:DNA gyrase inhibitor YacG [Paracoccaceae bacterium]